VGLLVGEIVGLLVGEIVGLLVGEIVGLLVGEIVGLLVGVSIVPSSVGIVGDGLPNEGVGSPVGV